MLLGFLCPSLIPQAGGVVKHLWALYRLRPLWTALRDALPITQAAPATRRSIRTRLYRCVIEIRDALLILQPYARPEIATRAGRLATALHIPTSECAAAIEATRIAAALHLHRSGAVATDHNAVFHQPAEHSFTGELRWLVAVATAYRSSPLVPALLGELGQEATIGGVPNMRDQ
ncbi:DUF6545 domain-containing protein [Nocardia sp. 004]|uniref:DUF6545 domain-containing protein n=1 Tax=Nocardia sp. 004 TaxID=3385978 RepID=UPI0039A2E6F7